MTEFKQQDLGGARFEEVSLRGAVFRDVDLVGARFENVNLNGARIRALFCDVAIEGEVRDLTVWGVEVMPLVDAELNRRYPGREMMRPSDADGYREAWALLEELWGGTVERARRLPAGKLHESVNGEWSFIETLRHLVFATDAWVRRTVLGDPAPWDPLDLPHDEMRDTPPIPRDRAVRPSLDEVLVLRADRMATVRTVIAELTDEQLTKMTEPVTEPGYPASDSYQVSECLGCILSEEWEHRMYAERDLAVLEKSVN
ncbi:DinB family protein [Kribbella sp. NPDC050124]|uniref:DinB family protein n=1 Tax=Kribbella sp. NPDC050124 TaxID=3364114 RepID=UPI0037AB54ED